MSQPRSKSPKLIISISACTCLKVPKGISYIMYKKNKVPQGTSRQKPRFCCLKVPQCVALRYLKVPLRYLEVSKAFIFTANVVKTDRLPAFVDVFHILLYFTWYNTFFMG